MNPIPAALKGAVGATTYETQKWHQYGIRVLLCGKGLRTFRHRTIRATVGIT